MYSIIAKITLPCVFFVLASCARADEAAAVLERAIQAHGGAARLERTTRGHIKAEMKAKQLGNVFQVTWEETFDLPNRYKRKLDRTQGGAVRDRELGFDGRNGWIRDGQDTPKIVPGAKPDPLEEHWHSILAQLLHLRSKDTKLQLLGEETRSGRRLVGIRFVSPSAARNLSFDKSTGLLAREQGPLPSPVFGEGMSGEKVYGDYREVDGVQYPMHWEVTVQNASSFDIRTISLDFIDKIEESVFAKPAVSHAWEPPSPPDDQFEERPRAEAPARWDMRLIVATLVVGSFVAVVWLIVRGSKGRKQAAPPQ